MDSFPVGQPLRDLLDYPVPAGAVPELPALRDQYLALGSEVVRLLPDVPDRAAVLEALGTSWLRAQLMLQIQYQGSLAARGPTVEAPAQSGVAAGTVRVQPGTFAPVPGPEGPAPVVHEAPVEVTPAMYQEAVQEAERLGYRVLTRDEQQRFPDYAKRVWKSSKGIEVVVRA